RHGAEVTAGDSKHTLAKEERTYDQASQQGDDCAQQRDRIGVRGRDIEHALRGDAKRAMDGRGQPDEEKAQSTIHGPSRRLGVVASVAGQSRAPAAPGQRRRRSRATAPPPASTRVTVAARISRTYSKPPAMAVPRVASTTMPVRKKPCRR